MTNKRLVVISYCFIFLAIYFGSMAYALISESLNKEFYLEIPQSQTMNSTVSAISSVSSWSGIITFAGVSALVLTIIFIILGSRSMACAI